MKTPEQQVAELQSLREKALEHKVRKMPYRIHNMDGTVKEEGPDVLLRLFMTVDCQPPDLFLPDHGSVSIEIAPGIWINFLHSEWADMSVSEEPRHHKNE